MNQTGLDARPLTARLQAKTWLFTALVILSNTAGNFALSFGMKHSGDESKADLITSILQPLLNPWVLAGIALLIFWTLTRMALLSWADLSFVLPVTSIGYALTAVLGFLFLNEEIDARRWTGIALITAGAVFVGRSQHASKRGSA